MGEKLVGKLLYEIQTTRYTGLIVLDASEVEETMRTAKKLVYMGEILIMRKCDCQNLCICYMRVEGQGTYTATYDLNGNPSCFLVADTLVQCHCGRKYRTPSCRALSNIKLHEIVEARSQRNCN